VRSPALLLAGGGALLWLALMRFGIAELGWIAFAPMLVALHQSGSPRRHLAVLGVLLVATNLAVAKIATSEIPLASVPLYAVPLSLSYFAAVALAAAAHRRLGVRWGVYTFAAATAALGWAQYTFTPAASWGALAHTQVDNLPLVQLASIVGMGGITFLVALGSGLAAAAWSSGLRAVRADVAGFAVVLGAALLFGEHRLAKPAAGPRLRVGGVVSPVTHREFRHVAVSGDPNELRYHDDELFSRSESAVDRGAQAVVWNEASTLVTPSSEQALVARGREFAEQNGVLLVMAYGRVESMSPFRWVNQYRVYLPDGTLADEYVKRHPVPGDRDVAGRAHARVIPFEGTKVTGAICYDYSFPGIARDNANDGADIALVPSSDWRGIDPLHGRMAVMNAVAAGLPMVRPVRAATSIATDAYGRLLASLRADRASDGVMVVSVPTKAVRTIYDRTGEVVAPAGLAFSVLVSALLIRRRRRKISA
jgi:apolipoprotein N-acyltransferase